MQIVYLCNTKLNILLDKLESSLYKLSKKVL